MAKGRSRAEVEGRIHTRYFPAQRRYHQDHDPEAAASVILDHEQLGAPRVIRYMQDALPSSVHALLTAA